MPRYATLEDALRADRDRNGADRPADAHRPARKRPAPDGVEVAPLPKAKRQHLPIDLPRPRGSTSTAARTVPPTEIIDSIERDSPANDLPRSDLGSKGGPTGYKPASRDTVYYYNHIPTGLGLSGPPQGSGSKKNEGKVTEANDFPPEANEVSCKCSEAGDCTTRQCGCGKWGYGCSPSCGCKGKCGNPFDRISDLFDTPPSERSDEGTPSKPEPPTRPNECFAEWFRQRSVSHPEQTTLDRVFATVFASLRKGTDYQMLGIKDEKALWRERWDAAGGGQRAVSDPETRKLMRELVRLGCASGTYRELRLL
ncbi:hypothetical protein AK830_g2622 [Neonectria ditissima]|uniref:Tesmin/TSO1-like CXC domain-containing protein n=1 Tax=Neonectria ditissima TaxID=78410 RepID=A0A0P7B2H0_9HYPO|nr:hypothetical protein AK830_g2622 [Neonectria ditissima]